MKRKLSLIVCLALLMSGLSFSQASTAPATQSDVAAEIQQMKTMLQQQNTALQQQQRQIEKLQEQLAAQQAAKPEAHAPSLGQVAGTGAVLPPVPSSIDVPLPPPPPAQAASGEEASPMAIHYKGITLTPGGFLAAESVYRSHGTASDVNTSFNSIPFSGAGAYHNSEFFGSGRQSRISLLAEGKITNVKFTGYYELDWLSAGVTSNNNQSNSYTNRQRQIWGQAAFDNGWSVTGGQMWSLVTETKKGLDNRSEALPMTIDAQYHVGFSWARQFGVRFVKNFNNKTWLGFALENPQTTFAAHGNASNFAFGTAGNGGGLYNSTANYSLNKFPDVIAKVAFEPGWGHYEIVGIFSQFRDRVYPNTASAAGAFNDTRYGGGIALNARGTIAKKVDLGLHFMGGDGIGRYATTSLPDATVRPDGTLSLIHNAAGLGTLEVHTKHWDWFFNTGAEYAERTWYTNSAGKPVGYGAPGFNNIGCNVETLPTAGSGFAFGTPANCTGDTRVIIEGTAGFFYKFYNGPKGRIQWGPQYSHLVRNTWGGTGGAPGTSEDMLFTSLRYYLP